MSSRSFLIVTYLMLNPNPVYMHDCTDNGSWRFSTYESLPLLGCADDPDWRRRHVATGDCAWVGELPGSRCDDKDENGIKAEDACGCACGPTVAPSVDPVVYDCAWVGENSTARCGSVSELKAEDACPKTCGDGTKDSGTWYLGEIHKNCLWVGENPDKVEKRCDKMGEDPAVAACALTCDAACALTTAPTTLGLDAFGDDEVLCEDDAVWSSKKGDCTWVAKNPDSRCSQAGYVIKGKDACLETCGDDGVDSDTWFFRKANKNCAWIGKQNTKKQKKLCKKSGTDGNACPATCGECPTPLPTPTPVPLPTPTPSAASPAACGTYDLATAVDAYLDDADAAEATYGGPVGEWDVSCVTDMNEMFYMADEFNGAIDAWDVSSVTSMKYMFANAWEAETGAFNAAIGAWDVSSVTDMNYMFRMAEAFNAAIGAWDVSSVTDMFGMFVSADAFNGAIDAWDVSSVTDMSGMFAQTYAFNAAIDAWDVSSVTNMQYMFYFARAFNAAIDAWDVSSVTSMFAMFHHWGYQALAFNAAIGAWDVSSVKNMDYMFYGAEAFNGAIDAWDVSSVTNMEVMFYYANAFNGAIGAWDMSSVTSMNGMFRYAYEFDQDLGWCVGTSVDSTNAFYRSACAATSCGVMQGCCDGSGGGDSDGGDAPACGTYNLGDAVDTYLANPAAGCAEATYGGPIGEWDVSCVTDMNEMFKAAGAFNAAIDAWDVSSVANMYGMFNGADAFNGAIDAWDVSSVTNMEQMFMAADAFNGAIDAWDVSSVANMVRMFYGAGDFDQDLGWCVGTSVNTDFAFGQSTCAATSCGATQGDCDGSGGGDSCRFSSGFSYLATAVDAYLDDADAAEATYGGPIGEWDISCVTDMDKMFSGAYWFNGAIDAWDVSSVTNMYGMFSAAMAFNGAIDAWDVSSVTNMYEMFRSAKKFNAAIDAWDVSSVKNMDYMFYGAYLFNGAIHAWDVSSVTSMYAMFYDTYVFDQDLGWCVPWSVNMYFAFQGSVCSATSCGVTRNGCVDPTCCSQLQDVPRFECVETDGSYERPGRDTISSADRQFSANALCTRHEDYGACVTEAGERCQWVFLSSPRGGFCRVDPVSKCLEVGSCVCDAEDFQGGDGSEGGGIAFHVPVSVTARDVAPGSVVASYAERAEAAVEGTDVLHPRDTSFFVSRVDFTHKSLAYALTSDDALTGGSVAFKVHHLYTDQWLEGNVYAGPALAVAIDSSGAETVITVNGRDYAFPAIKTWHCNQIAVTPTHVYVRTAKVARDLEAETAPTGNAGAVALGPFSGELFDVRVYGGALSDAEIKLVGAKCGDPGDLRMYTTLETEFLRGGCDPDVDTVPDDAGVQTYGSGAFATLWVAPFEYGTEWWPDEAGSCPDSHCPSVPDIDDPVVGRNYDMTEDVIDTERYFQEARMQQYVWERYFFEADMVGINLEPFAWFASADEVPAYSARSWNNPCRYVHQHNNGWLYPFYGNAMEKYEDGAFDLRTLYEDRGAGMYGFVVHETFHGFQHEICETYGTCGGRWLAESTASFGCDFAFPGADTYAAPYVVAPALPLNIYFDTETEASAGHFAALGWADDVRGGSVYAAFLFWSFLSNHAALPHLVGRLYSHGHAGVPELLALRAFAFAEGKDLGDIFANFVAHLRTTDDPRFGDALTTMLGNSFDAYNRPRSAEDACRSSCDNDEGGDDDAAWRATDEPDRDCAWVAKKTADRCEVEGTGIFGAATLEDTQVTVAVDGPTGGLVAGPPDQRPGPFGWNALKVTGADAGDYVTINIAWDDLSTDGDDAANPAEINARHAGCEDDGRFFAARVVLAGADGARTYWKADGKDPSAIIVGPLASADDVVHVLLLPTPPADYVDDSERKDNDAPIPCYGYRYGVAFTSGGDATAPAAMAHGVMTYKDPGDWFETRCTCLLSDSDDSRCFEPTFGFIQITEVS